MASPFRRRGAPLPFHHSNIWRRLSPTPEGSPIRPATAAATSQPARFDSSPNRCPRVTRTTATLAGPTQSPLRDLREELAEDLRGTVEVCFRSRRIHRDVV